MNDEQILGVFVALMAFTVALMAFTVGGFLIGNYYGFKSTMEEALERGFAVECMGERGAHWECSDD